MQQADKGQATTDGQGLRIAIARARFNDGITRALQDTCESRLAELGAEVVDRIEVGGALELPLAVQALARRGGIDGVVAIGCIIRGETYHFELVCNESAAGVTRVALDYQIPVANAIITTENLPQAVARQEEKGRDAAQVAVEMAQLLNRIQAS